MPFINIGSGAELIVSIPTKKTQNWNDDFRDNFATPLAQHDHTGSGKGRLIATAAIAADAVDGTKLLLDNDQFLRGRNAADSGNINIIKVNSSDKLALGVDLANLGMISDTYITGRNNADSGNINIIKVNLC